MSLDEQSLSGDLSRHLDLPNQRAVAETRLILALATLVVVSFIPPSLELPLSLPYGVIGVYVATALVLYWVVLNRPGLVRRALIYWLDAGWLLTIVGLAGDPGSPLFLLLLFPILVASSQVGFIQGMVVSIVTTLAYVLLISRLQEISLTDPELVLQAGVLLVLGFVVSRWAGAEGYMKRKLGLLNRLGTSSGAREDAEPFWRDTLEELAAYFGAGSALFIGREEDGRHGIYGHEDGQAMWSMALGEEQASVLAAVPEDWAICWQSLLPHARHGRARVIDLTSGRLLGGVRGQLQGLAETLDSRRWLSFPIHTGRGYCGRIFLLGGDRFKCRLELDLVQQLASQIGLKLENLLLARQLARVAASGERERISRDLHDGTVQPYLGLKFGLEALRRKVADGSPLALEVDELVRMTDSGIIQLRGYIHDLRGTGRAGSHPALTVIRAQVQQFEAYSGLEVDVRSQEFSLDESRLLDVRQIIAEGLSNIRRHTNARTAALELLVDGGRLHINFINPVARAAPIFTPRSLTERAAATGGAVKVVCLATETVVKVVLPLWGGDKT